MFSSRKKNQTVLQQNGSRDHNNGYMPGLDGLRALAVFAVIAYHLNCSWAQGGLLGVSLFFVLSGYLITNILLMKWELTGLVDLKDFWLRRARRLLPALFVMLAAVFSWTALFVPERLSAMKQESLAAVFYTSNWYLIFHHVSYFERFGPPSPLGHLWSLAVEEQFYLFWPLLLGLGLRYIPQRKWIIRGTVIAAAVSAAAMAMLYIPGLDPSRVYYGTDTRAFALLAGAVLAMVLPSRKMSADLSGKKRAAIDLAGIMGLLTVLFMIVKTNQYQTFLYRGGLLLFSIAAVCLIAALAHPASRLGRLFALRPFRWLGECSYGIYLWHYPVIALTSPVVHTEGSDPVRTFWQIAVSILLAVLSRYLIEEPIRYGSWGRFGRRAPGIRKRRKRSGALVCFSKISVSFLLIFLLLFLNTSETIQAAVTETQARETETQARELETQAQKTETQVPETEMQTQTQTLADSGQTNGTGEDDSAAGSEASETDEGAAIKGDDVTAIGDSLMIDIKSVLEKNLPGIVIDAEIGRQMHQAPDIVSGLQKQGKLGSIVIIELGTNGAFTEKQLNQTLDSLEGARKIVLVTTRVPRPWETGVNETLTKVSESNSDIQLVDWYSASTGHDEYFYPDGVHLNQKGAEAYGELILNAISEKPESGR